MALRHLYAAQVSAAIWRPLLGRASQLASWTFALPSPLVEKVLGGLVLEQELTYRVALALRGLPGDSWPEAHCTTHPRPLLTAESTCLAHQAAKGRIQNIGKQKLAGLLMPQDSDGELQVADLWGGGAQNRW